MSALDEFKARYRSSLESFIQGDPEPQKALWSRRGDATLANPLGPPAKGIEQIFAAMDRAAAGVREGQDLTYEVISAYETDEVAHEVAIQGGRMKIGDAREPVAVSLRVTSIFRREEEGWRLLHRHADPITVPRSVESLAGGAGA